jgi:hypothetical protein
MSTTTFYIDETGYTGEDLLNPEQPIFAQAALDFTDSETDSLLHSTFSGVAAAELKFSRLVRSPRHQDRVVELIRLIASNPLRAGVWVSHKEFAMLTFVVDWWIEPLAYQGGLNLYKDGGNLAMANMLYYALGGFWGFDFRHRLLMHFQRMMRARTMETYSHCEGFVRRAYQRANGNQDETLRYLWTSFPLLGHRHVLQLPQRVLDLALPGLIFIAHAWRSRREGALEVVHDQSTNIAKQRWLWDALSSPDLAQATFAHRGGTHQFPINVVSTRFADSVRVRQLQICDVLAGASTSCVQTLNRDDATGAFAKRLLDAGLQTLHIGGLWPSPDVTPDALGTKGLDGNQAIEWVTNQLRDAARPLG